MARGSQGSPPERPHARIAAAAGSPPAAAAQKAGALLVLAALATVVAVVGRVAAAADAPTLAESLAAIAERRGLYGLGGGARLISGVALAAGAWFLLRTWIIRERLGTPLVPYLLAASGVLTCVSGACALALAVAAADAASVGSDLADGSPKATVDGLRWIAGKLGFAAAGLALVVAARYQWRVGGQLRRIAPVSAITGLAMQFIWIDSATVMHPIIGTLFFLWLLVIGVMLATGRVERHFTAMVTATDNRRRPHVG